MGRSFRPGIFFPAHPFFPHIYRPLLSTSFYPILAPEARLHFLLSSLMLSFRNHRLLSFFLTLFQPTSFSLFQGRDSRNPAPCFLGLSQFLLLRGRSHYLLSSPTFILSFHNHRLLSGSMFFLLARAGFEKSRPLLSRPSFSILAPCATPQDLLSLPCFCYYRPVNAFIAHFWTPTSLLFLGQAAINSAPFFL